jgi:hypothetical protein
MLLILTAVVIFVSMSCLFIGLILAPRSINKNRLEKSGFESNLYILQIPHLYISDWYEHEKYWVWKLNIYSTLGCIVGFLLLYFLIE